MEEDLQQSICISRDQRYLELYHFSKQKHAEIISQLQNTIDICVDMHNVLTEAEVSPGEEEKELLSLKLFKDMCIIDKQHIERRLNTIQKKIYEKCKHCFVFDLIDLTPDSSKYIKYCELCELTLDVDVD